MLLELFDSLRQMLQVILVYPTDITENANVADVEGFLLEVMIRSTKLLAVFTATSVV